MCTGTTILLKYAIIVPRSASTSSTRNSELCFVFLQNIFEWMEFLKELYTLLSWLFGFWIFKKLLMRAQDELNFLECGARGIQ